MSPVRASNAPRRATNSVVARRRARIVALVESLPEAAATNCGNQHLSFEVRGKRFGYYLDDHHGDKRVALNCKAEPGGNQTLVDFAPERFHIPAYLGSRGWVGLWIDLPSIDWDEVNSVLIDAYRLTAPKRLVAQLHSRPLENVEASR
ncbi:MAG: MmcQ/YjbR family DNA-binding protein [Blastocatellia bacterium]